MAFTAIRNRDRGGRLDAFTSAMHAELREALDAAETDAAVRCVVLINRRGARAFSAGRDLTEDRMTIAALNGPTVALRHSATKSRPSRAVSLPVRP